jgi:hypothetical protein
MFRELSKGAANVTIHSFSCKTRAVLVSHTYLLLFIALFISAYPLLEPGISIGGDFPYLDTGSYAYDKLWIWLEKGGVAIYEGISRFPITSLWYILSFINIDASIASKIMILMGFALASFSFYFSFLLLFREKLVGGIFGENNFILKLGAIIGALFFAYNVWSFHRIAHWHFWIGYSVFPLFFISTYLSFKNPKDWKYILCSLFLWSFASATPHMTVFYGITFAAIFLYFVFRNIVTKKQKRIQVQILVPFLSVLLLYALINFYWLYPYVLGSNMRSISPDYVVSTEGIELLSRDSSLSNTFRLVADWIQEPYELAPDSFLVYLWPIATFAIPIFAFSSLFLSRDMLKYTLVFSGLGLFAILMAMGTNSPLDYYKLLLATPMLSNYVWIFRDPDKWSFLVAFAYSFLIGIGSYIVLRYVKHMRRFNLRKKTIISGLCMFLIVGSICVYSYPAFNLIIQNIYKPILIPSEFDNLNRYLTGIGTDKVYFMPYPLAETYWKNDAQVGRIYQMHSIKPSIESTEPATKNFYNYLVSSITENRSKNIDDLIYPLGTSYMIFHNDTWDTKQNHLDLEDRQLLGRIYSLEGTKNVEDIGFYHLFKVGNETGKQINLFKQNNIAIGGLELLDTLNALRDFSAINSSLAFIDDIFPNEARESIENSQAAVTGKTSLDDLVFSSIDDKYMVSPFGIARDYDPPKTWSKVGATDPLHGEFHPLLEKLGIHNREFDFGKGLAITGALGANITIPIKVAEGGKYDLIMRMLDNRRGGILNVYLDGELIDKVDTIDVKNTGEFSWKNNSDQPIYLENGRHTITLENVIGLNAVNLIGLVPTEYMDKLIQKTDQNIKAKKVIYLLEGETSFYNKKGRYVNAVHDIFNNNTRYPGNTSISGQFRTPENSDLVSLQVLEENRPDIVSAFNISNFSIFPSEARVSLLGMDFERNRSSIPLALLRHSELMNRDEDALTLSREMDSPISGNSSLRVDVNPVNKTSWSVLSTDIIPVSDDRYYEFSIDARGKNVDNFHVRAQYYDDNKTRIDTEVIYDSNTSDAFDDKLAASIIPPESTRFLKFEILVAPNNNRYGNYIIDNVNIDEVIPNRSLAFDLGYNQGRSSNHTDEIAVINMQLSTADASNKSSAATYKMPAMDSIVVDENRLYNYTANVKTGNASSLVGLLIFRSSDDVVENSTRYGSEASSGSVLSLAPNSEIYTEVDVIKSANYTIALRAKTCEFCKLKLTVDRLEDDGNIDQPAIKMINISLKDFGNSNSDLEWINLNNTYLSKGKYGIGIESNSQTDLDLLAMYTQNEPYTTINSKDSEDILNIQDETPAAAYLTNYTKLSPTEYVLEIENATRPYSLSLAETYDPLWIAYSSESHSPAKQQGADEHNFKTHSIPLFSIINGFHVNKTGSYSLTVKYEPQDWFFTGATVSAIVVILLFIAVLVYLLNRKKKVFGHFARWLRIGSL